MISRIFYPIGQGAFYAERHKGFNVVYDCGEWKNSKKQKNLLSRAFQPMKILTFYLYLILIMIISIR